MNDLLYTCCTVTVFTHDADDPLLTALTNYIQQATWVESIERNSLTGRIRFVLEGQLPLNAGIDDPTGIKTALLEHGVTAPVKCDWVLSRSDDGEDRERILYLLPEREPVEFDALNGMAMLSAELLATVDNPNELEQLERRISVHERFVQLEHACNLAAKQSATQQSTVSA